MFFPASQTICFHARWISGAISEVQFSTHGDPAKMPWKQVHTVYRLDLCQLSCTWFPSGLPNWPEANAWNLTSRSTPWRTFKQQFHLAFLEGESIMCFVRVQSMTGVAVNLSTPGSWRLQPLARILGYDDNVSQSSRTFSSERPLLKELATREQICSNYLIRLWRDANASVPSPSTEVAGPTRTEVTFIIGLVVFQLQRNS